jgi:hypothetical protein
MKPSPELNGLLNEVLASVPEDAGAPDFLDPLLQAVRRRRRFRQARRIAAVAVVCVFGGWIFKTAPAPAPVRQEIAVAPVAEPPSRIVVIASTEANLAKVVLTESGITRVVSTGDFPRLWAEIDDRQLLALVQGRGGLVRGASGRQELIFTNPRDWQGFARP